MIKVHAVIIGRRFGLGTEPETPMKQIGLDAGNGYQIEQLNGYLEDGWQVVFSGLIRTEDYDAVIYHLFKPTPGSEAFRRLTG